MILMYPSPPLYRHRLITAPTYLLPPSLPTHHISLRCQCPPIAMLRLPRYNQLMTRHLLMVNLRMVNMSLNQIPRIHTLRAIHTRRLPTRSPLFRLPPLRQPPSTDLKLRTLTIHRCLHLKHPNGPCLLVVPSALSPPP